MAHEVEFAGKKFAVNDANNIAFPPPGAVDKIVPIEGDLSVSELDDVEFP